MTCLYSLISGTIPFSILGVLGGIFFQNLNRTFCKQIVSDGPDYALSDLDLHCLPVSLKEETLYLGLSFF